MKKVPVKSKRRITVSSAGPKNMGVFMVSGAMRRRCETYGVRTRVSMRRIRKPCELCVGGSRGGLPASVEGHPVRITLGCAPVNCVPESCDEVGVGRCRFEATANGGTSGIEVALERGGAGGEVTFDLIVPTECGQLLLHNVAAGSRLALYHQA
jgi:hypothetical protein